MIRRRCSTTEKEYGLDDNCTVIGLNFRTVASRLAATLPSKPGVGGSASSKMNYSIPSVRRVDHRYSIVPRGAEMRGCTGIKLAGQMLLFSSSIS